MGNLKGHTGSFSQRMSRLWVPVLKANGCYIDAYVPAIDKFREILKEHTLKRSHQETSFLVNVEICHCLLGLGFMPYIFYVKAGEVGPNLGSKVQFNSTKKVYQLVYKKNGASSSGKRNSNPFDALNTVEKDDELGTNEGNSKLVENGVNSYVVSSVHETSYEAFGSPNTTHLATRINDLKRQMLDKKLVFVDDDGEATKKEPDEQWKETYNENSYDNDDFDDFGLIDAQIKFANKFDFSLLMFGHALDECLKKIVSDVLKNLKNPRRVVRGVQVDDPVSADNDSEVDEVFNETPGL
ncbi:hypothetical protein Tco_0492670 [Tanacetum coccineum]